jgi:nitroreductase
MTEIMDVIKERRSVREFEDRDIPAESLNTILEAAQWSQSWANTQCWEIILVEDPGLRTQLRATMPEGNPATKAITEAPLLLALCGTLKSSGYFKGRVTTKFGDWFLFDLGLVTQNLCLAAHALGLGTVVVGLFDHDKAKEILSVPDTHELVTLMPLGYPAQTPTAPKRRAVEEFTHQNSF